MKLVVTMRRERRSGTRYDTALSAKLGDGVASTSSVLVEDVSSTGFLMMSGLPMATGDDIDIDLPVVGRRSATVVRRTGLRAGCAFSQPLSPDELLQVTEAGFAQLALQRQRAAAGWRPDAATLAA
jgi:hypothetical protein